MSLTDQLFKHVPEYYSTMYKDGFTQTEIWYAFRKKIYKDIEDREKTESDPDDGLEIKITSEVKKK